jgi:alkanesulfonate monooxygenase SsuD/methylene tetrahydromethanopterin reductase-like flavin-dependent oxidoreductase (luciferase family)
VTFRALLAEDEAGVEERRRELEARGSGRFSWFVGTPEQLVEEMKPWAERGAGDFLLGTAAPWDFQTIELVATQVAPVLRAEVAA